MARFVEFWAEGHGALLVNPDSVVCVYSDSSMKDRSDTPAVKIRCVDLSVWCVAGTVQEVLAKLQGDPQPEPQAAKAGDDIAGWWIGPSGTVYYVIGRDYWGRWVYQVDGHHNLNTLTMSRMEEWTRDPNRKGWDR